jgi:hypothetical protein
VPAAQPEAAPSKIAVVTVAPKPSLTPPAKAAPPHFPPPVVATEPIAASPPPKVAAQPPAAAPISKPQISETDIHPPTPVRPINPNELRPANFIWFGGGLLFVSLVSFGYPVVRGRLIRSSAHPPALVDQQTKKDTAEPSAKSSKGTEPPAQPSAGAEPKREKVPSEQAKTPA